MSKNIDKWIFLTESFITIHGPRKDFFQGGGNRGFFQNFPRGPKLMKFVFSHSKLTKQPFFANNFKI